MLTLEWLILPGITENKMVLLQWGVVIGASLAAAIFDLRERRIPNMLCGPLFIAGLICENIEGAEMNMRTYTMT